MNKHVTMEEFMPEYLATYDTELTKGLIKKYNLSEMDAFLELIFSETYKMLSDVKCGMWEYGTRDILDMLEAEKKTGNPRNVEFLRSN